MEINQQNKEKVWKFWQDLDRYRLDGLNQRLTTMMSHGVKWYGPDPILKLNGISKVASVFFEPLFTSFPDLTRQTHIFFGGQSNGRLDGDISKDGGMWVTGTGLLEGTFEQDYLGIPANGQPVQIRWGEFYRMEGGEISEIFCLLDLVDLMQQAGYDVLPPSLGQPGVYPPPQAGDGILLSKQEDQETRYSLDHIRRFIFDGLNGFDQSNLKSMGMADYFHPDVKWYGPGGIGACLSFKEFEDLHQRPWLIAYPDRQVQDLDALFAEGSYSGGPGFPGVNATHTGPYLDAPASGNRIAFNGLDWWKREGEQYVENWVFVDMIHLFRQLGIDLFERIGQTEL